MTTPQFALVVHALALIAALFFAVPALTGALGGPIGYLLSLCVYWLGFCLPVLLLHVRGKRSPQLYSEKLPWRDWWVPFLLLGQVLLVAIFAFVPNTEMLTTHGAMLALVVALVNGPLEEIAWRGGFMTRFADAPRLGRVLSLVLYTAWHIPLLLSHGIRFTPQGDMASAAWALVGGAFGLGLVWTWIAWRTGSVFWTAIAHALVNVLTFWVLFNGNGFVAPHH